MRSARVACSQHEHRHFGFATPQSPQHFESVENGSSISSNDQIVFLRRESAVRPRRPSSGSPRHSPVPQRVGQGIGQDRVIFNDEYAHERCPVNRIRMAGTGAPRRSRESSSFATRLAYGKSSFSNLRLAGTRARLGRLTAPRVEYPPPAKFFLAPAS